LQKPFSFGISLQSVGSGSKRENQRHFGKDLITMDFAIFAIAFNLGKLPAKGKNTP
jgi:hypothetical protein